MEGENSTGCHGLRDGGNGKVLFKGYKVSLMPDE